MRKPVFRGRPGRLVVVFCVGAALAAAVSAMAGDILLPQTDKILILPKGQNVEVAGGMQGTNGAPVKEQTAVTLTWNDQGIDAVFTCIDSAIADATATNRDNDKVWKDDCVGLFLDPGHTHDASKGPSVFLLSAAGGLLDRRGQDIAWNAEGVDAKVTRDDKGWIGRITVPWKALGATPAAGEAWGLNVTRIDHEGKTYANMKFMSWVPFTTDYESVDLWGHAVFAPANTTPEDAGVAATRTKLEADHMAKASATVFPHTNSILAAAQGEPATVTGFTSKNTGLPAQQETAVTVQWDAAALKVVFDCADSAIVGEYKEHDAMKMWKDDCVAVFLDPQHTHNTEGRYIFMQISASGALHDLRDGKLDFDVAGADTKVTRTDKGWRAEITAPWKGLGVEAPKPGSIWGLNLTRIDQPGHYDPSKTEYASWAPNPTGNDTLVDRWGHLVFLDKKTGTDGAAMAQAIETVHQARRKAIMTKAGLQP